MTLTALASVVATAAPAHAENTNRFSLFAQGDGQYYEAAYAGAPASPTNAASSLEARANLNSQGNSTAYAGAPYYGATAQTLPGTANGLVPPGIPTGPQIPFTTLPGFVDSRFPTKPTGTESQPNYRVLAKSGELASSASGENGAPADAGKQIQQQYATGDVIARDDGSVASTATGGVNGYVVGPIESINASATATITEAGNGSAAKVVSRTAGTFTVGGMTVSFDEKGFTLPGQTPQETASGLAMVNSVLAQAGYKVETTTGERKIDPRSGVTSFTTTALRVTTTQGPPGQDPVKAVYSFARVSVGSVSVPSEEEGGQSEPEVPVEEPTQAPVEPPSSGPNGGGTDGGNGGGSGGGTGVSPDPGIDPQTQPGAVDPVLPPDVAVPTDPGTDAVVPDQGSGDRPSTLGTLRNSAAPTATNSGLLYLALVLAGAGVLGGQQLFSRFGIRLMLREA